MNRYDVPSSISIIDKVFFVDSSIRALSMTALQSIHLLHSHHKNKTEISDTREPDTRNKPPGANCHIITAARVILLTVV